MKALNFPILLALVLIVRAIFLFDTIEKTERFVAALPAEIETEGLLMREAQTGLFNSLLPDHCGINVVRIADSTVEQLKKRGLRFLENATRSRSGSRRFTRVVIYKPWQAMAATQSIGDTLFALVLSCAGGFDIPSADIIEGLKNGTGFVSYGHGAEYYLLPDQKLFVQVFMD